MNLDVSTQLVGVFLLNVIALLLFFVVEVKTRRQRPAEREPIAESPDGLDRWIEEIEAVEHRQAFASGGEFLPHQGGEVNG